MYKLLLCSRYLRTLRIALASIVSVTLGVATLIIVNAVMEGFSAEMQKRLNGILSDVVFESHSLSGFPDAEAHMAAIRETAGDDIEGMTATVHVPAMISIEVNGQYLNRQITLVGIDRETYARVSDFSRFLLHPKNRRQVDFRLHEQGYAPGRADFPEAGWRYRRRRVRFEQALEEQLAREAARRRAASPDGAGSATEGPPPPSIPQVPSPSYAGREGTGGDDGRIDPLKEQRTGIILGIAICSQRGRDRKGDVRDFYFCRPGDDVIVTLPNAANPPRPVDEKFTVVDLYESKMSEYDSSFAFVPLDKLQDLRGMVDPASGKTAVTSILIKVKPGRDLNAVRDKLRARFPIERYPYRISTWKDLQGPLLSAVSLETLILNILLFLIIAVAGFGILGIFFMIVVEKTRDIGILKSLGAPSRGVMAIFLGYGLMLGSLGASVGLVCGLLFVHFINEIADGLAWLTGRDLFDPTVYYFQQIPTIVHPGMLLFVVGGAIAIAVAASVFPARKAAQLHPVEALRYE